MTDFPAQLRDLANHGAVVEVKGDHLRLIADLYEEVEAIQATNTAHRETLKIMLRELKMIERATSHNVSESILYALMGTALAAWGVFW